MSVFTAVRKMILQTPNFMSSGGSSFEALTTGDIQAVMMSCDATPLIFSFFEAKHKIRERYEFEKMLVSWMYNRLQNKHNGLNPNYVAKNHETILNASYELSEGLSKYLARHKIADDKLGSYFDIEKSKFSRYYAPFLRGCVSDLEFELGKLERQISDKLKDE